MKTALKVLSIVVLSALVVCGIIKLFMVVFPHKEKAENSAFLQSIQSYKECRSENKEKILAAYQKCVADAKGNNVRCQNSAIAIFCQY